MTEDIKGTNTIRMIIYFETGGKELKFIPKVAFKKGTVYMPTNHRHGIRASKDKRSFFGKSQNNLLGAIKECLAKNDIKLIDISKEKEAIKYMKLHQNQNFLDENYNL